MHILSINSFEGRTFQIDICVDEKNKAKSQQCSVGGAMEAASFPN